jgi:hypothetical protein
MRELLIHKVEGNGPEARVYAVPGKEGHAYSITWQNGDDSTTRRYCEIEFQNGPVREVGLNGIQSEHLLSVLIDRLRFFQSGAYSCRENAIALTKLEEALYWLQSRTRSRVARGVEGTNEQ